MPDSDFIESIAKQLPVRDIYKDAVRPTARQLGGLAEDLMKTLRLALFPFQFTAAAQDRLKRFVSEAVNRVPEMSRVAPAPQIAGPIFEGIRYEPEGTPVDKLFSELLSASMDDSRLKDVHPSFPQIVRQLSPDEAKILAYIAANPKSVTHTQVFKIIGALTHSSPEADDLQRTGLVFPENVHMYREHLERLGLIRLEALKPMEPIIAANVQTGGRNTFFYSLSDFGRAFARAVRLTQE